MPIRHFPVYQAHTVLKRRIKDAGLTVRQVANALLMPPGTLSNQLLGWTPLSDKTRKRINEFIASSINSKSTTTNR